MAKYIKQYIILFSKAKTDFSAAKLLFANYNSGSGEIDLEVVCFHLQQTAEKCLKAVLSKNSINYPRVHDLELLINYFSGLNAIFCPRIIRGFFTQHCFALLTVKEYLTVQAGGWII